MRLLNTLRKTPDKYLSHFLKYKGNTNICLKENKDEQIVKYPKRKGNNDNIEVKKDKYPEFDKEGFPCE